jgi:hypothetical protein
LLYPVIVHIIHWDLRLLLKDGNGLRLRKERNLLAINAVLECMERYEEKTITT